jgi:hypothetical protein
MVDSRLRGIVTTVTVCVRTWTVGANETCLVLAETVLREVVVVVPSKSSHWIVDRGEDGRLETAWDCDDSNGGTNGNTGAGTTGIEMRRCGKSIDASGCSVNTLEGGGGGGDGSVGQWW